MPILIPVLLPFIVLVIVIARNRKSMTKKTNIQYDATTYRSAIQFHSNDNNNNKRK